LLSFVVKTSTYVSGFWDMWRLARNFYPWRTYTNHKHTPRSHVQRPGLSFGIRMNQIYPW